MAGTCRCVADAVRNGKTTRDGKNAATKLCCSWHGFCFPRTSYALGSPYFNTIIMSADPGDRQDQQSDSNLSRTSNNKDDETCSDAAVLLQSFIRRLQANRRVTSIARSRSQDERSATNYSIRKSASSFASPKLSDQDTQRFTQKRKYLQHLRELVGDNPRNRTWKDEFYDIVSSFEGLGMIYSTAQLKPIRPDDLFSSDPDIRKEQSARRVWFSNLERGVNIAQLSTFCSFVADVVTVDVFRGWQPDDTFPTTNTRLCCGYADFATRRGARRAFNKLRGRKLRGRKVRTHIGNIVNYFRFCDRRGWAHLNVSLMTKFHEWNEDIAEMIHLLVVFGSIALGRSVRKKSPALAASCHALSNAIAERARSSNIVAPPLYLPLHGRADLKLPYGLVDVEPETKYLECPDSTGSCAVHCSAPRVLFDSPGYMRLDGSKLFNRHTSSWVDVDSDIVCVQSLDSPPDAPYLQTAVPFAGKITQLRYVLPPNTLLTLQKVEGPPFRAQFRRWVSLKDQQGRLRLLDRKGGETGEEYLFYKELKTINGVKKFRQERCAKSAKLYSLKELNFNPNEMFSKLVNRRLLTVTPRYMLPTSLANNSGVSIVCVHQLASTAQVVWKVCIHITGVVQIANRPSFAGIRGRGGALCL